MWFKSNVTTPAVAAISFCLIGGTVPAVADILHVPGDYLTIQEAIDAAMDGDEVEVQPGTYNENINLLGKAITVRSSDGAGVTTIDAQGSGTVVTCSSGEGPDTVLRGFTITGGNAVGSSAFLDDSGGGIYILAGSPTIENCLITWNTALRAGGGVFTAATQSGAASSPQLKNCTLSGNSTTGMGLSGATGGGGLFNGSTEPGATSSVTLWNCTFSSNTTLGAPGGGMIDFSADSTLIDCEFIGNSAAFWGGGLSNGAGFSNSTQWLTNCKFIGNSSANKGGGMFNHLGATVVLTNCIFSGNISNSGGGGGLFNRHFSTALLTNCTFSKNSAAARGGGIKSGNSTTVTLANCVLWGNTDDVSTTTESEQNAHTSDVPLMVNFTLIEGLTGGFGGTGNIGGDPLFVDFNGLDDTVGTSDDDLRLASSSPCIDAADNTAPGLVGITEDLDGNPRFVDDPTTMNTGNPVGVNTIVDMGAFEFQFVSGPPPGGPPGGPPPGGPPGGPPPGGPPGGPPPGGPPGGPPPGGPPPGP